MYSCTDPCLLHIFAALLEGALCGNSDNVIIKMQLFNYVVGHHSWPALLHVFIFFIPNDDPHYCDIEWMLLSIGHVLNLLFTSDYFQLKQTLQKQAGLMLTSDYQSIC